MKEIAIMLFCLCSLLVKLAATPAGLARAEDPTGT